LLLTAACNYSKIAHTALNMCAQYSWQKSFLNTLVRKRRQLTINDPLMMSLAKRC